MLKPSNSQCVFMRVSTAATIVIFSAQIARSETWHTYHNARFGLSADYPGSWTALPPPVNGDGRSFRAPGSNAVISISGSPLHGSRQSELESRSYPDEGEVVTYTKRGPGWVVVSGIQKDDVIFYRKSIIACNVAHELSIEYPVSEKRRYDSIVSHVSNSLDSDIDITGKKCF